MTTTDPTPPVCSCCGFRFSDLSRLTWTTNKPGAPICPACFRLQAAAQLSEESLAGLLELVTCHISWCTNAILEAVGPARNAVGALEPGPWHPVTVHEDGSYDVHCMLMDGHHDEGRCTLAARIQMLEERGVSLLRIGPVQRVRFAGGLRGPWLVQAQEAVNLGTAGTAWRTVGYYG